MMLRMKAQLVLSMGHRCGASAANRKTLRVQTERSFFNKGKPMTSTHDHTAHADTPTSIARFEQCMHTTVVTTVPVPAIPAVPPISLVPVALIPAAFAAGGLCFFAVTHPVATLAWGGTWLLWKRAKRDLLKSARGVEALQTVKWWSLLSSQNLLCMKCNPHVGATGGATGGTTSPHSRWLSAGNDDTYTSRTAFYP